MNFKIFKVPIFIHFSFWLFALLIIGSYQDTRESIIIVIAIMLSLLTHEYGHAYMASYFHAKPTITLYAFGGKTDFDQSNITDKQYFFIILSGTLFQGILIFITHMLINHNYVQHHYYLLYMLTLTKHINIIWTALNLLPLIPFDGGWLLRYILKKYFGRKGYRASIIIGIISATLIIPYLYIRQYHILLILQLLISGLQYCKLWQEETQQR